MTDAELLARFIRSKDQAAFAEIVDRHAGLVVAAARRLAPLDADDVAQATFFLLAQRAPKLLGRTSLAGWLYETARHCARNARRGRSRHERKLAAIPPMEPPTPRPVADAAALLDDGLARLPSAVRDVVLLRHVESLSVAETAERLGVAATTVTKRSERGLSRLRDFFAARGVASASTATIVATLATPTTNVDAATLATAATGKATAAVAALATKSAVPAALAVAAAAALVVGGAAAVAVRPPASTASVGPTTAPTTRGVARPPAPTTAPTEEAARAVATSFLKSLRDSDRAGIAAVAYYRFQADEFADRLIANVRNGPYAAFPQRLALGGNGWFQMASAVDADGTTRPGELRPASATLEAQTPIEADIGRLVLKLNVAEGEWKVATAEFVADGATYAGPRFDLASAASIPLPPDRAARANAAWERATKATAGTDVSHLTAATLPAFRVAVAGWREATADFVDAIKGSPLAVADADFARVDGPLREVLASIDAEPLEALQRRVDAIEKDAAFGEAMARLHAAAEAVSGALDAAEEARPTTPRPPVVGPPETLRLAWLGDEAVRIRGPVGVPEWLRSTRAFKRWEDRHDIRTFRTRDDAGSVYEISVNGSYRTPAGESKMMLNWVRRYRPDGTLSAIAHYGFGEGATDWGELDETGRRYTFRIWSRVAHPEQRRGVTRVDFFGTDGSIRRWSVEGDLNGRVNWESLLNPIDELEQTVHFIDASGKDRSNEAVDLPIDGLPVERE